MWQNNIIFLILQIIFFILLFSFILFLIFLVVLFIFHIIKCYFNFNVHEHYRFLIMYYVHLCIFIMNEKLVNKMQ